MSNLKLMTKNFDEYIKESIVSLKKDKLGEAYQHIMDACNADPNAAEAHNLLGIWYEFKGNSDLARKHYRIAYVLDPTYRPASENLERVSTLFPIKIIPVNYGEEILEETNENGTNKNLH